MDGVQQKDDIIIADELPLSQLQEFQEVGIHLPQFVQNIAMAKERFISGFRPWGWSKKIAEELGERFPPQHRKLYGKSWGAECLQEFLADCGDDFLCPLQTVGQACTSIDELVDAATKNRYQQKPVFGYSQLLKALSCFFSTRIGEADGIHKATGRVLAVNRLAITSTRLRSNTLGGDHTNFGKVIEDALDNAGSSGNNA